MAKRNKPSKYQHDLAIVLVNYNGGVWLDQTLNTLQKWYLSRTKKSVVVYLVDNASTDGSFQAAQKKYPWLVPVALTKNKGFAAGNNTALQILVQGELARNIMLLNTDMELDQRSNFDHLVSYLDEHPETAVVSPQVILSNGKIDPASHRGEPTPWAALTYFSGLEKLFPTSKLFGQYHQGYQDLTQVHAIDACSGAAMMVRTDVIKKVGLLDEQFFMYAEDLDWCRRFRQAGFEITFLPNVVVTHHKNKSGLDSASKKTAKSTRNHFYNTMLQYFDKHHKPEYPSVVRWLVQLGISIKKGLK